MNRFVLKKYLNKNIHISLFNKYFYKNKRLKLYFGDHVDVQNDLNQYGGSKFYYSFMGHESNVEFRVLQVAGLDR